MTGDANVSGAYRVAGTPVVGPRGAAVTSPNVATSAVTAGPAPTTYTAVAQNMLDQSKAAIASLNSDVTNLKTAVDELRARLQAHGLIA